MGKDNYKLRVVIIDWSNVQEKYKKKTLWLPLKLIGGMFVFEVIKEGGLNKVNNDYKFASDNYMRTAHHKKSNQESYLTRDLEVCVASYPNKPHLENQLINVSMSDRLWERIVELTLMLDKFKYPRGKYLAYWKRNFNMVWFAFLDEKKWAEIKEVVVNMEKGNREQTNWLKEHVYWRGNQAPFRLDSFKDFYGVK